MAERDFTYLVDHVNFKVVRWDGLQNGDTGKPFTFSGYYPDKSVHVFGTPGTNLHVYVQGTNETGSPSNWAKLADSTGTTIDITSLSEPVMRQILQSPVQIRPYVTGDASTNVSVIIAMRG